MKWRGYSKSQNSWVLQSDLNCDDLVREFERRQKPQKPKTKPTKVSKIKPAKVSKKVKDSPQRPVLSSPTRSPKSPKKALPSLQSPVKSNEERRKDKYKELLSLPIGSWESKVGTVDHVSEPEDNDLVIHVKLYNIYLNHLTFM